MHDRIIAIQAMRKMVGQELSIVGWVEGPLALAAELRGLNALMMDFFDDEAFVCDLLDFCTEVAMAYAGPQIEAGADTIKMSDATASLIGPDVYGAAGRCHAICGKRHIVNGGCEVSPITPPANLWALIRYAREHKP